MSKPTGNLPEHAGLSHKTVYRFHQPVRFEPQRLMLRPREGRDIHLLSSSLVVTPDASVSWTQDVFGNALAAATFRTMSTSLEIVSKAEVEHYAAAWPVFDIAASAISYPFRYSADDLADLGTLVVPQYVDPHGRLLHWVRGFIRANPTDTL